MGFPRPTTEHFFGPANNFDALVSALCIITCRQVYRWPGLCPCRDPDRFRCCFRLRLETTMDIARPSNLRKKRIRQAIYAAVGLLVVVLVSVGLSRLRPAAPTVERAVVWPDSVKRGPMVREVRGL